MTPPTPITTHVADAKARLVEQYKRKPNIDGILQSFVQQYQDMEDVINDMFFSRFVNNAVGRQLDLFGTIVDLDRQGFDDTFYRILLNAKIGQNISSGDPERVISTLVLLTGASQVMYQNLNNATVGLAINTTIPANLVDLIFATMQSVVMAGIRIDFIVSYDATEPFSFDGIGPIGLGFSSLAAPTTGGKFAFLNIPTP